MLPSSRHSKELIEHAEEHIRHNKDLDMKVALIHSDNSIEVMLKGYLRYSKYVKNEEVEKIGFYELITRCEDIALVKASKSNFLAYHDLRNTLYHQGALVPEKEDVISAIELAKSLFNELNSTDAFSNAKVELISGSVITNIANTIGNPPYLEELRVISKAANIFINHGFQVSSQSGSADVLADVVAEKGKRVIVCEIKKFIKTREIQYIIQELFYRRQKYNILFNDKNIEFWIISQKYSMQSKNLALQYDLKLLNLQEIESQLIEQ
jgi:Holliday junction resolvase